MSLVDTETMRDAYGRTLMVGHTVNAHRWSTKTGTVFDFSGYVCAVRKSDRQGRLEALCQPFSGGEAKWLGGSLIELPEPDSSLLEGVLAEWHAPA